MKESEFRKTSVSSEGVGQQDIEDGSSSSNPLSFSEDEEGYTKKINMDQYLDHGSSSEIRESLVVEVNKKSAKVDRQRYKEETEDQVELQEEENLDDDDEEEEGDGDLFNSHSLDDVVVQAPQITLVKETTEIKAPAIETENGDFDEMWREDTFKFWYDNPAGGNSNQLQSKASISSSVKSETKSTSNKLVTAASEKATTIVDHIDYMDNTTSTTEIKPAIRTPSSSSIGRSPERRGSSRLASKPLPNPPSLVASATAATETKTSAPQSIASSRNPSSEILKASSDKTSSISNRLNMLDEIRQLATSNRGSVLEFKIQRIEKFLSSAILELKQKDYMENALKEMMGSANSDNTNESIMSPEELVGSISEFFQKSKMESLSLKSESARLKEIIALEQEEKINKLGLSEASFSAITSPPTSSYNAEELDHLKSNIKRLCSEKEDLETRLEQSALSNKNLTSIYDSTSKKIKDLEDQVSSIKQDSATALDRANSSIQLLSSEKASLESRLERSEATNQDLALSLEKSLSSSNESNTSAGDERLNHANSTIQKLAAEKSRLESQLENQVKQAKISKSENDMSCEVMIKKIKDLEILNLQARERITELENRLHNNEQQFEVSKSQSELRSPQSPTKLENSALHNQVAHLNEEISSLKSSKQAEVRLLKAELEIITAEKMKLIEQIAALNERLTNKAEFSDEILARDQAKMLKARQVDKDKIVWLEAELAKIEAELKAAKLQEIETGCKLEEEKLKGKHMSTKCAIFVREIKFRRALNRGVSERATELTASDENLALGQELEYYGVLEKESISLKQDLEHVTAELKSSEDALRVATDQLNMTNLEAQNSLQHSSLKSQGLEKLIYENRVNIQDQAEQIKRKDERIKEFETVIQSKLQEIKNQAESMQVLNDQNGKLQRMHDSMAEKSDALEKELESKTGLIKSLQTQVKDLKLNILEINTTNIINKTGSLEHQDAIKYYENEIKIVTAQLEEERQLRSNIEAEHNKVLESLSSFEENFTVLRQLHERDVEYTRELEGEKERLESRIERQLAEMEESKRILQKQYNSIQDTTRRLMETESELNKKTLDLSKSESALNAKQMEGI